MESKNAKGSIIPNQENEKVKEPLTFAEKYFTSLAKDATIPLFTRFRPYPYPYP